MSYTAAQLLSLASQYQKLADQSLTATAKKKEKKKLDPKAKVRNRGTVCVPAESAKDKKDHFPINDEAQARNALARVHQYSSTPSWYGGSLKSLQSLVSGKVHSKYPSIGKADKKSKKSYVEVSSDLIRKYGQTIEIDESTQPIIELDPPPTPKPTPKPIVAPVKPVISPPHEKKWWETPMLDKERIDPFTGKPYEPPVAKKSSSTLDELIKKYQ